MTWLGWNRPTLGHEADLRKFAVAFRALPKTDPVDFSGSVLPDMPEVWVKWFDNRLAVVNDSSQGRTITLTFASPLPVGEELVEVVTGKVLMSATQANRSVVSLYAEPWSLQTIIRNEATIVAETTLAAGWHLISLPIIPADPTPVSIFNGIPINGALFGWNPDTDSYVMYLTDYPDDFGDCEVGAGYWLHLSEPATISYEGTPTTGAQHLDLSGGGWRLIGQPFYGSTPLMLCTVTDQDIPTTQPYYDAALDGWVSGRLWAYDAAAGGYVMVGPDPWHVSGSLTAWSGYWVWGANMNLTLDIPQP